MGNGWVLNETIIMKLCLSKLFSKQIKNLRKGDNLIQVPIEKTLPKQMLILRLSNQRYLGTKKVFKH